MCGEKSFNFFLLHFVNWHTFHDNFKHTKETKQNLNGNLLPIRISIKCETGDIRSIAGKMFIEIQFKCGIDNARKIDPISQKNRHTKI